MEVLRNPQKLKVAGGRGLPIQIRRPDRNLDVLFFENSRVAKVKRVQNVEHVHTVRLTPRNDLSSQAEKEVRRRDIHVVFTEQRINIIAQSLQIVFPIRSQFMRKLSLSLTGYQPVCI